VVLLSKLIQISVTGDGDILTTMKVLKIIILRHNFTFMVIIKWTFL